MRLANREDVSKAVGYASHRWFRYLANLGRKKQENEEAFLWPDWMHEKKDQDGNLLYPIAEAMLIHLCVLYPDRMEPVLRAYGDTFLGEYRHTALEQVLKARVADRASDLDDFDLDDFARGPFEEEEIPF